MQKGVTIGNYEYSNTTMLIGAGGFALGLAYGIFYRKGAMGTIALAIAFSLVGTGVGTIINKPVRV